MRPIHRLANDPHQKHLFQKFQKTSKIKTFEKLGTTAQKELDKKDMHRMTFRVRCHTETLNHSQKDHMTKSLPVH